MKNAKLIFLFISFLVNIYANILLAIGNATNGYIVPPSSTIRVNAHGVCKRVTNNDAVNTYYIPTRSAIEWSSFVANHTLNITLSACVNSPKNCGELLNDGTTHVNGRYMIDPDGDGLTAAFATYCDFTTDGGGWNLVWSNLRGGTGKPVTSITYFQAGTTLARCSNSNVASTVDSTGNCTNMTTNKESVNYFLGLDQWNKIAGNKKYMDFKYEWSNNYGVAVSQAEQSKMKAMHFQNGYPLVLSNFTTLTGSIASGLQTNHIKTPALKFSATDLDQDLAPAGNCGTFYSNTPFWYEWCWSGSINGGGENSGGGYFNGAYWTGSAQSWATATTATGAGNGWMYVREYDYASSCYDLHISDSKLKDGYYRIDSDGPGGNAPYIVYCDMSRDGGGWTRVFHHDVAGGYFANATDALSKNLNSPESNLYSILDKLDDFKENGKYLFKISWPGDSVANIWTQTTNPTINQAVAGYVAISVQTTAFSWGGLEHNCGVGCSQSFIDGSVNYAIWFYAIGSYASWNGGIPAHTGGASALAASAVNLWIKDVPITVYKSCNDILLAGEAKGDGIYTIDPDGMHGAIAPFKVYCDMTTDGGGWTLIASGGTSCTNFVSSTNVNLVNCGYLPEPTVKSIAVVSSLVRLRSGASHTSFTQANSTNAIAIQALQNSTQWNSPLAIFDNWSWTTNCTYLSTVWPNMFHACGNNTGVHWTQVYKFRSNFSSPEAVSSTWIK